MSIEFATRSDAETPQYLMYEKDRLPLRLACTDDLNQYYELNERSSRDRGRNPWWPSKSEKMALMEASVLSGSVYVVEDGGSLVGAITVKDEGDPMLWHDNYESALYFSHLMADTEHKRLGEELVLWLRDLAYSSGQVCIRCEVIDREDARGEKLRDWYRELGFIRVPSKLNSEWPASALFELNVGTANEEGTLGKTRIATPQRIISDDNPFTLLDDLTPYTINVWRRGGDYDFPVEADDLMGSLINGALSSRHKDRLFYKEDAASVTGNIASVECVELDAAALGLMQFLALRDAMVRSSLLRRPVFESSALLFNLNLLDLSEGPINIRDALSPEMTAELFRTIGPARFLVRMLLTNSNDTSQTHGKQYFRATEGEWYEWDISFLSIERPAITLQQLEGAWKLYEGASRANPGVLAEGIFDGKNLVMEDTLIPLLGPDGVAEVTLSHSNHAPGQDEFPGAVIKGIYAPPVPGQLGPQPYIPQIGDSLMARFSVPHTRLGDIPYVSAELYKVSRKSSGAPNRLMAPHRT